MTTTHLTLYYFPGCPYCQKVLRFLKDSAIPIPLKDIHANGAFRQDLIKIGGKAQVPCLVINGQALYESNDIIAWLRDHNTKQ